jgi:DNA-binding NtrC family response regulator
MRSKEHILLIEDADSLREVLAAVLTTDGFSVKTAASVAEGLEHFLAGQFDCIVSDFKLPDGNGISLLKAIRQRNASIPFLLMTAYGTIDIAVEAMRDGASDFLTKPFDPDRLSNSLREVIDHKRIIDRSLNRTAKRGRPFLTRNKETSHILEQAKKVARVDSSVLILGESGTGKELLARYIHEHSACRDAPFVAVNCAALPAELLESEFFGHESGAFTGATQTRIGVLELAGNGTLFLDEVGDMPARLQVKLLRALQEKEIKRVGGTRTIPVNPRVISATNIDIEDALASGALREDFYFRLAVISFTLPPLRRRAEDLHLLSQFFIEDFALSLGRSMPDLSPEASRLMSEYPWPGNSRELENVIERAMVLAGDTIKPEHLELKLNIRTEELEEVISSLPDLAARVVSDAERKHIQRTLQLVHGNKSRAARMLGVSYKTLLSKIKEYEVQYVSPEAEASIDDIGAEDLPAGINSNSLA